MIRWNIVVHNPNTEFDIKQKLKVLQQYCSSQALCKQLRGKAIDKILYTYVITTYRGGAQTPTTWQKISRCEGSDQ